MVRCARQGMGVGRNPGKKLDAGLKTAGMTVKKWASHAAALNSMTDTSDKIRFGELQGRKFLHPDDLET